MRKEMMKAAKQKAGNYCAYQERTHQEARDKLYSLGLYRDEVEEVLSELISENFLNEERYAKSFAGGKFRMKQWGRRKILYALKQKNISPYCIDKAMQEIDDDEYEHTIRELIAKKRSQLAEDDAFIARNKIFKFLIGKGYESEVISAALGE